MEQQLQDFRCTTCNKLLFKGLLACSVIEIKCKGCKQINNFSDPSGNSGCGENCPCNKK